MSRRSPLDANTLAQFTGSQHFCRDGLVREVLYTEGMEYVAETAGHTGCWMRSRWRSDTSFRSSGKTFRSGI